MRQRLAVLILAAAVLSGCASFRRNLVDLVVDAKEKPLERCDISGFEYKGLADEVSRRPILKVLMVHGVGTHYPGYSERLQENLARQMKLGVRSRLPKNISLLDPRDGKTYLGNLRVTYWQNKNASKNMLFYELTWSPITTPEKQIIAFDTTEQYTKFRVPFNNEMKIFLDETLPDPMLYLVGRRSLILESSKQSVCWMLKTEWDTIPDNREMSCFLSSREEIRGLAEQNLSFVTHSLGSEIVKDALLGISERVSRAAAKDNIARLQNKELTIYMLANQLPILALGRPLPKVHNQIAEYCTPGASKYGKRIFKAVNIVAFSDPNDLLSYAIPQGFADKYIDSRICPRVTNVSVNVAPEISAFGIGVVNPVAAHTDYDTSPKVINLITHGTYDFGSDRLLEEKCRFTELKKDRTMTAEPQTFRGRR